MRLDQIAAMTINQVVGRLARRAAITAAMALCAIIALYQLTVAGTVALELQYGPLYAHLIIAGIYAVLALVAFAVLWTMRTKPAVATTPALDQPREMQLVMLVEAVMLGYALARKGGRASD